MKRYLLMVSVIMIFLTLCIACNGDSVDFMLHDEAAEGTYYYASGNLSAFTERAVKSTGYRVTDDTDEVPDIFVVKGSDLATLSEKLTILAEKTLLAGKAFVVESPTFAQLDDFWTRINDYLNWASYEDLYYEDQLSTYTLRELLSVYGFEEGDNPDYTSSSNEHIFDAIGMREGHVYFVHDIDQIIVPSYNYSEVSSNSKTYRIDEEGNIIKTGETPSVETSDSSSEDWEEIVIKTAELFAKWLKGEDSGSDKESEKQAVLRAFNDESATQALENAKKAKSVSYSFTVVFNASAQNYDNRYNGKKEVVTTYVNVWTACDIDTQKEYWLVNASVLCNNQQLGFVNDWGDGEADSSLCAGPYFDSFAISLKLPKGNLEATQCSPQNAWGSTSFTTGSGFNIGANAGFNSSGPTGGVSTGFSFSTSSTTSIPDISITFTPDTADSTAEWKFAAPELTLERDDWWFFNGKHILHGPKSIQTTAATFDTYSLFTRDSNADSDKNNAMFEIADTISLACIKAWNTGSGCKAWVFPGYSKWVRHHIPFTRPSNVSAEYIMNVTCPEGSTEEHKTMVNNALKEYFPDWASNVTYYSYYGADSGNESNSNDGKYTVLDEVAKNNFTSVKQKITTNKNVLKDRGFSGTYTFYIQNVEKANQPLSFSLTF